SVLVCVSGARAARGLWRPILPPTAVADGSGLRLEDLVPSPEELRARLGDIGYLADEGIATALFCAVRLPQPVLLEGEAGVGKTEASKAPAPGPRPPPHRLQCYRGIDPSRARHQR